jgi:hypothetical protein
MSYNTKALITDVSAMPIPQYYNPDTDAYEAIQGAYGANRILLYGPNGEALLTGSNPGVMRAVTSNVTLVPDTTITWDGVKLYDVILVPASFSSGLYIKVGNEDQVRDLVVTVELEVTEGTWVPLFSVNSFQFAFSVDANSKRVYGAFPPFSKYLQARLKFTAALAPAITKMTVIQVQEVG